MRDAFTPVGLYTVSGEKVIINVNMIQKDLLVGTVGVEVTVANEASKTALIQKLTASIIAEAQKKFTH